MPRLPERLGKLKGKSIDELRVRCAQAAHARLERIGLSRETREPSDTAFIRLLDWEGMPGKVGDGDALLQYFRENGFELDEHFPGLCHPAATARQFQARCPRAAEAIVTRAEHIAAGRVEIGHRVVSIGARPDWLLEPVSGKRAPATHWSQIAFLDPLVAGDCKFTWELNRHQYFVTLAQAYALTADERHVSVLTAHLSSWMDDNPPKIGINWTSSLELALRAISWTWALHLVRHSPTLDSGILGRALKYLYLQTRHIERNLSTYFSPNTHLTGEALALLYVGTAFPVFKRAADWRAMGARVLVEQLDRQLFADGVYFEQSTYYHRYTADFYLHALLLTASTEHALGHDSRSKIHALLDYLVCITRPDGTSPFIGDDDGGRLVMLAARAANDFRDTLALGAAVLRRGDCAYVARDSIDELLWLLGPNAIATYDSLTPAVPAMGSRAFVDSGYFVMRDSWAPTADWAIVRCGPHARAAAAHAHADALAIELSVGGEPMLIDPGTYVYTTTGSEREYFRSSAAHNTVTVDECSSAEPAASPFKWKTAPHCRATAWMSNEAFAFFEGEHDGYQRLPAPAVHSRAVFFLKDEYWVIRDRVRSAGAHDLALHLHWAPDITLLQQDDALAVYAADEPRVNARLFAAAGQLSCEHGWVSPAYGTRAPAPICIFRVPSDGTVEIVTVIAKATAPIRWEDCVWRAGSSRESGVLTIAQTSTIDTILTGPTRNADLGQGGVISDGTWTWVRRSLAGEPLAFALVQGRRLLIDREPVLDVDSILDCAVGEKGAAGWEIDTLRPDRQRTCAPTTVNTSMEEPCAASVE